MKVYIQTSFEQIFEDLLVKVDLQLKKVDYSNYVKTVLLDIRENSICQKVPQTEIEKALDNLILTLEYYYQLPIYFGNSPWNELSENDFFYNTYEETVNNETEPRLHFLIYTSLLDDDSIEKICRFTNIIPHGIDVSVDVLAIPTIVHNNLHNDKWVISNNIHKLLKLKKESKIIELFFVDSFDEDKVPLQWDIHKLANISSDLLIYLCSSVNEDTLSIDSNSIKTFGIQRFEIDRYAVINNWAINIFKQLCKNVIGNEEEQKKIDKNKVNRIFGEILDEERDGLERINNLDDDLVSDYLKKWQTVFKDNIISKIIDANLTNAEKDLLLSYFQDVTNRDLLKLEEFDFGKLDLFDSIYMPFVNQTSDKDNPYLQLKDIILQIQKLKEGIKDRQARIEETRRLIDKHYHRDGIWTEEGYKIGNDIFRIHKTDLSGESVDSEELLTEYIPDQKQSLPRNADLKKYFPPIKNQGKQGACASFSLTSVFEYFWSNEAQRNEDMSEAFVYYNARALNGKTSIDDGANLHDVIRGMVEKGVCVEELCKYNPEVFDEEPSSEAYEDGEQRKVTSAKSVPINVDIIKSAINEGFPVVGCFRVFKSLEENTSGFIPMPTDDERNEGSYYHAMVICGYNDKHGHFIVRNSWGPDFGDNGYCYLPYSYVRDTDLTRYAVAITGISANGFVTHKPVEEDFDFGSKDKNIQYAILNNMLKEDEHRLELDRKRVKDLITELRKLIDEIKAQDDVIDLQQAATEQIQELEKYNKDLKIRESVASAQRSKTIHVVHFCILLITLIACSVGAYLKIKNVWLPCAILSIIELFSWIVSVFLYRRKKVKSIDNQIELNNKNKNLISNNLKDKIKLRDKVIQILNAIGDIDRSSHFNRDLLNSIILTLNDCYQQIQNFLINNYSFEDEDMVVYPDMYEEYAKQFDIPILLRLFKNKSNQDIAHLLKDIQKEILEKLDANFNKNISDLYGNTSEWNDYVHSIMETRVYAKVVDNTNPALINESSVFLSDRYMPNIQVRSNYIYLDKNRYIYILFKDVPEDYLDVRA